MLDFHGVLTLFYGSKFKIIHKNRTRPLCKVCIYLRIIHVMHFCGFVHHKKIRKLHTCIKSQSLFSPNLVRFSFSLQLYSWLHFCLSLLMYTYIHTCMFASQHSFEKNTKVTLYCVKNAITEVRKSANDFKVKIFYRLSFSF